MLASNLIRHDPKSPSTPYYLKNATLFGGNRTAVKLPLINSSWTGLNGVYIKEDGLQVYLTSTTARVVIQLSLLNPYNLWSIVNTKSFSVLSQETNPLAVTFSSDGTTMHVMGSSGDDINQYTLSTPWDVTTASYAGVWTQPATVETTPYGLTWKSDGTQFYFVGSAIDTIKSFNVSTPWDVLSTVTASTSLNVSLQETGSKGVFFSSDGSKLFLSGVGKDGISSANLGTPWNVSSAGAWSTFLLSSTSYYSLAIGSVFFENTGHRCFIVETSASVLFEIYLPTAWDLSSYEQNPAGSVLDLVANFTSVLRPGSYFISPAGTYGIGLKSSTDNTLLSLSFSTAHDPLTMTVSATTKSIDSFGSGNVASLYVHPSGTYVYWIDSTTDSIYQLRLTTPWDITSAASTLTASFLTSESLLTALWITNNGTYLYYYGQGGDSIYRYTLTTPYMISTKTNLVTWNSAAFPVSLINKRDIKMSEDGKHLYIADVDSIYHLVLSQEYEVGSATLAETVHIEGVVGASTWDEMYISPDGKMLYLLDAIQQINKVQLA